MKWKLGLYRGYIGDIVFYLGILWGLGWIGGRALKRGAEFFRDGYIVGFRV